VGIKILIVDDEPDIRDVMRITLEGEKYEVFEASNGEEALASIQKNCLTLFFAIIKCHAWMGASSAANKKGYSSASSSRHHGYRQR